MAITSKTTSQPRNLPPVGNHVARCFSMIEIGTNEEIVMGTPKRLHKVRIGWELSNELYEFKEGEGLKPYMVETEYTLSMGDKANLRKDLQSWRGAPWTDAEAQAFDITKLIGAPCLLNVIHKPSTKDPSKVYEKVAGISPLPKGMQAPALVNEPRILSYDDWKEDVFQALPQFIKDKIMSSDEYKAMKNPVPAFIGDNGQPLGNDLPFNVEDDDSLPF